MKNCFLIAAMMLSFSIAQAQSKDEKEITDLLNQQAAAWNRGSLDEFMHGYWENDSLMYIGKTGVTYGYANALNNYRKNYSDAAKMGKLFFQFIKMKKLSPEYYWVAGKWFLKRSAGDVGGHFTLLFRRIAGKWLIVADHSS